MTALKSTISSVLFAAGATLACVSAQAAPACGSVSPIERRIVDRADNGEVDALRAFVRRTSIIYGVDMIDVRDSLDQWRAAIECQKQVAAAEKPAAPVAQADATPTVVARR
jgi:hypothetical protein